MGSKWMPMLVAVGLVVGCGDGPEPADDGIIDDEATDEGGGTDGDDDDGPEPDDDDDDDDDEPGPDPDDDDDDDDVPDPHDDDDDDDMPPPPTGTCRPTAERFIVLGDSIVACQGVGGTDSPDCAPKQFHTHYDSTYQTLPYENRAVSGARTADVVNQQLATVPTGMAGHALVVIYVGGNDLSPNLLLPDAAAESNFAGICTDGTAKNAEAPSPPRKQRVTNPRLDSSASSRSATITSVELRSTNSARSVEKGCVGSCSTTPPPSRFGGAPRMSASQEYCANERARTAPKAYTAVPQR